MENINDGGPAYPEFSVDADIIESKSQSIRTMLADFLAWAISSDLVIAPYRDVELYYGETYESIAIKYLENKVIAERNKNA
jgi:hypothetical protein